MLTVIYNVFYCLYIECEINLSSNIHFTQMGKKFWVRTKKKVGSGHRNQTFFLFALQQQQLNKFLLRDHKK